MFSWLKRIAGVHQEAPAPVPTPESDRADYQTLLEHYEDVLKALEDLCATRGRHPVAYEIDLVLPGRWEETHETLTNRMAWCDRNMDAIEERAPELKALGYYSATEPRWHRRRDLWARRSEVET